LIRKYRCEKGILVDIFSFFFSSFFRLFFFYMSSVMSSGYKVKLNENRCNHSSINMDFIRLVT